MLTNFLKEKLLFNRKNYRDYSFLLSEARYKAKYGRGIKILRPKQMLQRLPIDVGNTSKNLLNEIRQIIHSLYQTKEIVKKLYNNNMNSIKL